jgi:ABC-2 type transport system ATP-binding protein
VHGYDVFENSLEVRRKLGYLPQRAPLYPDMTVWDYLKFTAEIRGLDEGTFHRRLKKVVEVCGLAQTLGKDIGTLSHGFRQRVGLGQALIHDPPILILDEPTSDLDPNEKAEVLKYIREMGRDRTILLSTHNLAEVEETCARVIIISKGRVVADGQLDEIRARAGRVRYVVTIDEKSASKGSAPKAAEVRDALASVGGAERIRELPTDEKAHKFELSGEQDGDLRGDISRLITEKGWILLELRRETQSLDAVFRDLTRGEEKLDRGEDWSEEESRGEDEDEEEDEEEEDEDEDEEEDDEEEDEEEDEDEEDEDRAPKQRRK